MYGVFSASLDLPEIMSKVSAMLGTCRAEVHKDSISALSSGTGAVALAGPGVSTNLFPSTDTTEERVFLSHPCFNVRELAGRRGIARRIPGDAGQADIIASLIAGYGPPVIGDLNGVFSLASQQVAGGRILVANDRFGLCPLYYHVEGDLLLVATEARAICAVTAVSPDLGGWGDIFYAGVPLGSRTLFRGIKALGPGEYLLWEGGRTAVRRYHDVNRIEVRPGKDVSLAEVNDRFRKAVEIRLDRDRSDTLLLGAGFDSRLILGAMLDLGYRPLPLTVSYEKKHYLVRQLSESLHIGCEVRPSRTGIRDLRECIEYYYLNDGMLWNFLIPHPGSEVYPWIEEGAGRVWDGMALDFMLGGNNQFEGSFRRNARYYLENLPMHRPLLRKILRPDLFQQLEAQFRAGLNEELDAVACFPSAKVRDGSQLS